MNNPFEVLEERLSKIESLIHSLRNESRQIDNKMEPERLLTVQEAAKFLNLTVPTIYSKVSRGELPVMKRSKRLYFSNIQLLEYLKAGSRKTNLEIEIEADKYCLERGGK